VCYLSGVESALQPLRRIGLQIGQQHGVEATRSIGIGPAGAGEPVFRRQDHPLLLAVGNALGGAPMGLAAAQAYFDECDTLTVFDDEIDLAASATHVPGDQLSAPRGKMSGGKLLGRRTPCLPGLVGQADNACFD